MHRASGHLHGRRRDLALTCHCCLARLRTGRQQGVRHAVVGPDGRAWAVLRGHGRAALRYLAARDGVRPAAPRVLRDE